jgi:acyl dehydratase
MSEQDSTRLAYPEEVVSPGSAKPLSFSDIVVGAEYWSQPYTLSVAEVVDFAREWDPQYYHVDENASANSIFGRLTASGIHSFALSHRIFNDLWLFRRIGLAGIGMENFRWRRPVYPGDTLRVRGQITDVHLKDGDRAIVTMAMELFNQESVVVLRYDVRILVRTDR